MENLDKITEHLQNIFDEAVEQKNNTIIAEVISILELTGIELLM